MKNFTVKEILEYSRDLEQESYTYYTTASETLHDAELKSLTQELAAEELKHFNRINTLLENSSLTPEMMSARIGIASEDHEMLVATRTLPENPTPVAILTTALQREVNTRNVYKTLITITDLTGDIINTFEELAQQEEGHANRIRSLIKKYA